MKKNGNKWLKRLLAGVLVAIVVVGGGKAWTWLSDNKLPNVKMGRDLFVYPDTTPADVLAQLDSCVRRPGSLKRAFEEHQVATYIQPGHYMVKAGQTSAYISRMLNNCWQTPVQLRIPAVRLKSSLAKSISSQMMVDSATVAEALINDQILGRYGFSSATAFSLFIPDTYEVYWTDSVDDIFARQKKAWDAFWTADNIAKAKRLGLSKLQVSILASIVKGESNLPKDYPKLAGVYINRLKKGMKLQACPTVAFLLNYETTRILNKDLQIDSPYNTYKYAGLPPGPIAVPGKEYLNAVLNPDTSSGYLFFCADPSFDGSHRFARTYSEHMKNSRDYQAALAARGK
ncbi:MAG: endolytic transglycosylase MltG [Bacteroidales bacterium]|nr:endolytic transglycosylase MltG [Bacteroidales bacterium]